MKKRYVKNKIGDLRLRIALESCFAYRGDGVMRVLVIPDIHLKPWIFDRAEKILKDGIISTDVFSTYRDGRQIGESAMIVIDSETGKYEKIEVMGKLGV